MLTQKQIVVGNLVRHRKYGLGEIRHVWGQFYICPTCHQADPRMIAGRTACHGIRPESVAGSGVVDVRFIDGTEQSINKQWLDFVPVAERKSSQIEQMMLAGV